MKSILIAVAMILTFNTSARAQLKETAQLATLSPIILVVQSDMENYKKSHYMVSTIGYLGSYMISESKWKAALFTLLLGASKEIVYDELLGRGEPLWEDMKWNTLGITQGLVFTVSLKF